MIPTDLHVHPPGETILSHGLAYHTDMTRLPTQNSVTPRHVDEHAMYRAAKAQPGIAGILEIFERTEDVLNHPAVSRIHQPMASIVALSGTASLIHR